MNFRGVLTVTIRTEIIPLEPDVGSAAAGKSKASPPYRFLKTEVNDCFSQQRTKTVG